MLGMMASRPDHAARCGRTASTSRKRCKRARALSPSS
jgi:hypothetical protein